MVKQDDEPCEICGRGTPRLRQFRCELCGSHFCLEHARSLQYIPECGNICSKCNKILINIVE